ncbi:MAG: hypothetical protein ACOY3N_23505 [Bradyrhizobium sp.]|uniref:hypothetical protein n=1 Tax=Bradyrhizobium sp. TaxID=376 RepID=UPI003BEF8A79
MTDEELKTQFTATAGAAVEAWKANRNLPYLSPAASNVLADLLVAALVSAYNAGWQEGHNTP